MHYVCFTTYDYYDIDIVYTCMCCQVDEQLCCLGAGPPVGAMVSPKVSIPTMNVFKAPS